MGGTKIVIGKNKKGKMVVKSTKKYSGRRGRYNMTNVVRGLKPFASRYITKMKYSGAYTLQVLNNYSQIMNLNSLFDPDRTGIGHQPYGFDQLSGIYNRYRVISCRWAINAYSGTTPIRFACLPCNEIPPINNVSEICENPRAQFKLQYPQGGTTTIKGRSYIPSLVGRTKAQYMADDRYQATSGASPAELALLFITGQSMADAATDINLTVTLEYTVEWFDPHPIDQS